MIIPTLVTDRLILRPWKHSDIEPYSNMCADREVMEYLGGNTFSRLETWRHMAYMVGHWQLRGYGHWVVENKVDHSFLGRMGFINPEGWPGFELGWALVRSAWGQGFAFEGAKIALNYGFNELKKSHIISLIHPSNHRSRNVAMKLGETLEGKATVLGIEVDIYGVDA